MPLFLICLLVFAAGIAIFLVARLLSSYPIVFFALIFLVASSVMAIMDGKMLLAIFWLAFSAVAVIASGLHFYKNIRGAFWWSLGAVAGMIVAAVPIEEESILAFVLPVAVFAVIGLLGSLLVPRLTHRDKNERKHRTNSDTLIGQRIKITKGASNGRPQRGLIGDVDWAVEPLMPYESFKVGDVVVITKIKGVTLLCTRDGKDYRQEEKQKRKEAAEKARIEAEQKRAKREAVKAAKRVEAEKEKAAREEAKAKRMEELRKIKAEREAERAKQEEELKKVHEDRLAAAKARKEELRKQREAEAARKAAEEANKPAKEEPKAEEPKKEEKPAEKPAKEEKKEKVVKEKKECFWSKLDKNERLYSLLSACILLICLIVIILCCIKAVRPAIIVIIFIFFILALAYLVTIFVLEVLRQKQPAEEVKEEPAPAVEEPKKEEPAPKKEKAEFVPFSVRMKEADPFLRDAYNELKAEVLSYGIKSRVSSTSDRFRLHKKEYVKMVIAGQFLKLYFALNPEDYKDTTYPFDDAGRMGAHKDTPFVFKIKSGLSIRRAKQLINDVASKDGLTQGEVVAHDYATDLEQLVADDEEETE